MESHEKPAPLFATVDEVARLLGCSRSSVYVLMKSGDLPFKVIAGRRRVPMSALRALADTEAA